MFNNLSSPPLEDTLVPIESEASGPIVMVVQEEIANKMTPLMKKIVKIDLISITPLIFSILHHNNEFLQRCQQN